MDDSPREKRVLVDVNLKTPIFALIFRDVRMHANENFVCGILQDLSFME